jgi:CheY-like chemotaxis protein
MGAAAPRTKRITSSVAVGASERRRHRRMAVPAVAAVSVAGKHLGIFAVADLSDGGALLVGEALAVPGQLVELLLQLPGHPVLKMKAKVLRRQVGPSRGKKCGVKFEPLDAATARAFAAARADVRPVPAGASVLLLWQRPGGNAALQRELSSHGIVPLVAASALEAAAWLRAGGKQISCVLIDYLMAGSNGWDFLQHLREDHPDAKRILLVDGVGTFRLNLLLASGLADAVLEKPWTAAGLWKKLGRRAQG